MEKHDPNKDYNVFWELLLSSSTPKFEGFYTGQLKSENDEKTKQEHLHLMKEAGCNSSEPGIDALVSQNKYLSDLDISLKFEKSDANLAGIKEIQKGVLDFVKDYHSHFKDFPYMFNISGRDAYAPMLAAASRKEKYLKAVEKRYKLEINVD